MKTSPIPKAAKKLAHTRLAEGEVTGHYHNATGGGVALYEHGETTYLSAPNGSTVTHQEHGPVALPPGNYVRKIVKEYDHATEEARDVID